MPKTTPQCDHVSICSSSSSHSTLAGFKRPGHRQRLTATRADNRVFPREDKLFLEEGTNTFPAPLVLPGDDLAGDPEDPQTFQDWLNGEHRNPITPKRKTIYVVQSPQINKEVDFIQTWTTPTCPDAEPHHKPPRAKDVQDYLSAFYHGLPVRTIPPLTVEFLPWEEAKPNPDSRKTDLQYVGLRIDNECIRIRARTLPNGIYRGQVNLDDLLDAAISLLPKDAYALLMLVDFDLYEDEDDEFVCGRAYGGSRVAVVSSARYNPVLDRIQGVERLHAWPASHCEKYMSACCAAEPASKKQKRIPVNGRGLQKSVVLDGPLKEAVSVYRSLPEVGISTPLMSALWLGRVCRTASHELGHCFGISHCVYYACSMQGTASICEDARQPPYLCPVDLAKVLSATSTTASERYRALLAFCERSSHGDTHLFGPFAAWIRCRLDLVGDSI
ncbi:peptidase M54 [Penicillium bovifimosum]|uniref:Peptidase M54 archaemetzincin n=1 Tax=Penicillium bovifimosum TaxID=126998 RepID=A0A9W9GN12_9EURO|nr:peptidase M54 [Penicillium bovifimosum]KAJ5124394.1 Peptidase M54 archaemetzincin [Penicillium bovifimosum]